MADFDLTIDASSWTQSQRNGALSVAVELLFDAGITYSALTATNGPSCQIHVGAASADPTATLTKSAMESRWAADEAARAAAAQAAASLAAARSTEFGSNQIARISAAQIASRFEGHRVAIMTARDDMAAASTLAQAKAAGVDLADADLAVLDDIERLVKLLWARAVTGEQG